MLLQLYARARRRRDRARARPQLRGTAGPVCPGAAALSPACLTAHSGSPGAIHLTSRLVSRQFEIEGTLINVMKSQSFPSGFVKREFVVRTDEMYPQEVKFELYKDKITLIDDFQVNEMVKVSFNIRGSQWEGRYFTNLQAWRIERMRGGEAQLAAQAEALDLSEWDGYGSEVRAPPPTRSRSVLSHPCLFP